jgi:hypothetical protein
MKPKSLSTFASAFGLAALVVLLPSARVVTAQKPAPAGGTILYSGRLSDDANQPVADGAYAFTFALYDAADGGNLLWTETRSGAAVKGGAFSVLLGSATPLPEQARISNGWLAVSVRGPAETDFTTLAPRQPLDTAASASPSSPSAAPSCPHDHFGETWTGDSTVMTSNVGLQVQDTATEGTAIVGVDDTTKFATGVLGHSTNGQGVWGVSSSGTGVTGQSDSGSGVWGDSSSSFGVYGLSYSNAGVFGYSTSSTGVYGRSPDGTGVTGNSASGISIYATGTGVISSTAKSEIFLSPFALLQRNSTGLTMAMNDDGGMQMTAGTTGWHYAALPATLPGKLYGAQVYVDSLTVCYKVSNAFAVHIDATQVSKHVTGGSVYAINDSTDLIATSETCYTASYTTAGSSRVAIDGSSWVQFNLYVNTPGASVWIYKVELTVSEQQQ